MAAAMKPFAIAIPMNTSNVPADSVPINRIDVMEVIEKKYENLSTVDLMLNFLL